MRRAIKKVLIAVTVIELRLIVKGKEDKATLPEVKQRTSTTIIGTAALSKREVLPSPVTVTVTPQLGTKPLLRLLKLRAETTIPPAS